MLRERKSPNETVASVLDRHPDSERGSERERERKRGCPCTQNITLTIRRRGGKRSVTDSSAKKQQI